MSALSPPQVHTMTDLQSALQRVCKELGIFGDYVLRQEDCPGCGGSHMADDGAPCMNHLYHAKHRERKYPDTLTPELAWEIETRANLRMYEINYIPYEGGQVGGGEGRLWGAEIRRFGDRLSIVHDCPDRGTALILALDQAIGGK